jgi:hypothetical protein
MNKLPTSSDTMTTNPNPDPTPAPTATPMCDEFAALPMPFIPGKAPSQIAAIGWEQKAREIETRLAASKAEAEGLRKKSALYDEAHEALDGRLGYNTGKNEVAIACAEYVKAEDHLPEIFDSEDYCLSNAVRRCAEAFGNEQALDGQLEETRARIAELEADGRRLDWLEAQDILSLDWVTPAGTTCGMTVDPNERLGAAPTLRAAIDAAAPQL